MLTNGSDPIDASAVNDVYTKIDKMKDKFINLIWKQAEGKNDRTVKALDGKNLQVLAGTVPVPDKTSKNDESSIRVDFFNAFGGGKSPTVVAMPDSTSPYGVSVKNVTKQGFTLVIHQFPDNGKDDKLNISSVHYIAVGMT
jgi:hypothetical protein